MHEHTSVACPRLRHAADAALSALEDIANGRSMASEELRVSAAAAILDYVTVLESVRGSERTCPACDGR